MAKISVLDDNYPSLIQHFDLSETINENNILLDKSFNKNISLKITNPPTIEYDENLKRNVSVFNGTSNYIPIGKASKVTDAITINVLAYMDNWSNRQGGRIISCTERGGWNFFEDSKYSFYIHVNGRFYTYSLPIAYLINGWNMITMSFNGYDIKYYMNGVLINTINVSATKQSLTYNSSNGVFIGAESVSDTTTPSASQGYFKGKMADVRIYNEALSDDNVKKLFKSFNINRNIGEQLHYPNGCWKRIDDTDGKFSFLNFSSRNNAVDYNKTSHIATYNGATVNFIFYGSRIRIIGGQGNIFTTATVTIDGNVYKTTNNTSFSDKYQIIIFEKTDLQETIHSVSLNTNSSSYFIFDCIDIDDNGYLLTEEEYNQYIKEQKKNNISINKTLKANLPSSTTKCMEIHFTEDGEMYVNKQDGSFIKVNSSYKTYSSEETYNINDYVVYNNKLYKCIENITVAEDFNVSKWQIVLEGEKGDPGEKGLDAANISKLYCKDSNLYVDFDNGATKQIENFDLNIDTIGNSNIEDTPIGHIISFMGTKAPAHYIICDGSIYNITDYQKLADSIKDQFGSYNYFGGDGTTTFAVPDLRNEFLRGYHGESSEQLSGEIGKHQNATIIQNPIATSAANTFLYTPKSDNAQKLIVGNEINSDTAITETNNGINKYTTTFEAQTATVTTSYTTRPTNVAVLFCIKYENTYCVNISKEETYTDENVNTEIDNILNEY